jgi:repressor LexA
MDAQYFCYHRFMLKLTERQEQVLAFIKSSIDVRGYPPTCSEIAKALGFKSPNSSQLHLQALVKKGVIQTDSHVARGIRILATAG